MTVGRDDQPVLLSDLSDLDFVRHLLADLHDDQPGEVDRFRMLSDLGGQMGRSGTMIVGGHAAYHAWVEARSSFVHGNYVATILLCQGLVEHLLAAYLHAGLLVDDIPDRIPFADTLRRCRAREVVSDEDVTDLRRMMALRNPLSHFRHVNDAGNLDRRSIDTSQHAADLIRHDATFAIGLAVRILSNPVFRLGPTA
ncbi:hypothetical protein [Cereibacter johrii]|uniref:Uncharacterized protein n=1 Tax=Cereibacter johrii TaxID=445629 RepID=A0ABX5JDS4_9RHOB|nr:hypothetical protein [Cereibacter johrii]ODM42991.1 hypothetical protein A9O63_12995 [Cereibacter johrii]PTM80470.1 hypothetical protein C8J29_102551 [Cereibacter johrii]